MFVLGWFSRQNTHLRQDTSQTELPKPQPFHSKGLILNSSFYDPSWFFCLVQPYPVTAPRSIQCSRNLHSRCTIYYRQYRCSFHFHCKCYCSIKKETIGIETVPQNSDGNPQKTLPEDDNPQRTHPEDDKLMTNFHFNRYRTFHLFTF